MAKTIVYNSDVLDREFTYEIPFRITCNATGLVKTYTLASYINRKIDRFGGLEKLHKTYICKDAKRMLKEGKTIQEVIQALNPPKEEGVPASPVEEIIIPEVEVTPEIVSEKMEEILQEVEEVVEEKIEEILEKPLATKDKDGKWRNSRGHKIPADKLELYILQD